MIMIAAFFFAIVFSSFADGIDHGKGAEPLYDLWHFTRDLSRVAILLMGGYWQWMPWWVFVIGIISGHFMWEIFYLYFRSHGPAWDNKFVMPLGFLLKPFGYGRRT